MGFPKQEYWSHFLLQVIFLAQGLNSHLLPWHGNALPLSPQGSSKLVLYQNYVSLLTELRVLTGNSSSIDDKLGEISVDYLVYLMVHSGDDLY